MLVKEIELKNFKTISDYKANFDGGVYLITGENEVGKSTLLNAIATLLTGERSNNLLKQGEEKGFAKMQVDDYEVEIRFTEKNPRGTITIKTPDGIKSNNISTLQSVFQYQDFDAHDFTQWSQTAEGRRKQVEAVKSLLDSSVLEELDRLEVEVKEAKEKRKDVKKQLEQDETILRSFDVTSEEVEKYAEPVSVKDLFDEKDRADRHNQEVERIAEGLEIRKDDLEKIDGATKERVDDIERRIKELEEQKADLIKDRDERKETLEKEIQGAEKWLDKNKPIDTKETVEAIQNADVHNEKNKAVQSFKNLSKRVENTRKEYEELDDKAVKSQKRREELIASSKLPVEGLTFTDEGLFLNGVPFAPGEISTSQEMEVAAKLIIAKNPTVKVFRIAQGESLGKDRLESIVKFANENGYQGFIEEVRRGQNELIVENYNIQD